MNEMEKTDKHMVEDPQNLENPLNTEKNNNANMEKKEELSQQETFEEEIINLNKKLDLAIKQKDQALREKESMVIKYAVSEKNLLTLKQQKEQLEKKHKESISEIEILQHKVQTMCSEKARICQMLDNKCYEYKTSQQELEQTKTDLIALETKLKWSQNNLKTEMQNNKENQLKIESLQTKLQEAVDQIEQTKRDANDAIKTYHGSQDNRAHVLDQQLKEQQATLILLRHEKDDREKQLKSLQSQFDKLQTKQKTILEENNELSLKVQQLELERLENEKKLTEFKNIIDQQRQAGADLQTITSLLDQLKLQLKNEQDQAAMCNEQMILLKQRNNELESDNRVCREREAELLLFTQQLTDKNVRLQSEFTSLETKVQQLNCEKILLKRSIKEQEMISSQLAENKKQMEILRLNLTEKTKQCDLLKQEVEDHVEENKLIKRKHELVLKEINKELQQCRKKLEFQETKSSNSGSNTSLNVTESPMDQVKVIQADQGLDRQTLIEHIVKLQKISARKSEKLDFLEEHVNTLVLELQKKSRLLQSYILRDQSGTLTSNSMDNNKANIAKLNGIMASLYSTRVADHNLTLELSLDINRKLQAVLEDALLKNITLKENVDTLGLEIDRLNKIINKNSPNLII